MYIERLAGTFLASLPTGVIIDVNGVGYGVEVPLSTLCQLPKVGEIITLWIFTHVKEDAIRLFGFRSFEDRQAFEILLSLNGVGPKVALAILSTLTVSALEKAVAENEGKILETVPGVGGRLAERIILELKPKLMKLKAAHLLDLQQNSRRFEAGNFNSSLDLDEQKSQEEESQILFADLGSALENLGYKEKAVAPILARIKKENTANLDLQGLMRLALKQLSSGVIEMKSHTKPDKSMSPLRLDESDAF